MSSISLASENISASVVFTVSVYRKRAEHNLSEESVRFSWKWSLFPVASGSDIFSGCRPHFGPINVSWMNRNAHRVAHKTYLKPQTALRAIRPRCGPREGPLAGHFAGRFAGMPGLGPGAEEQPNSSPWLESCKQLDDPVPLTLYGS